MVPESWRVYPLPPTDPWKRGAWLEAASRSGSPARPADRATLGRSILRGGLLGVGLPVAGLLLVMRVWFPPEGV
jgi:hypothetical protein